MPKLTELIQVRVSPKYYTLIARAAKEDKRTVSDFVRLILEEVVEKRNGGKRAS